MRYKRASIYYTITFIGVILLLTSISPCSAQTLTPTPVSTDAFDECLQVHMPFDDGAGTTVSNVGEDRTVSGTIEGAGTASWQPTGGIQGGALHLDGSTYVNLEQPDSLNFKANEDNFTISIWAKMDTGISNDYYALAARGTTPSTRSYALYHWRTRAGAAYAGGQRFRGDPLSDDGENWHHYVLVNEYSHTDSEWKASVYIDGALATEGPSGVGYEAVDVLLGARRENSDNTGASYFHRGSLDQFRAYCRALSAIQVWQLYELERTGTAPSATGTQTVSATVTASGTLSSTLTISPSITVSSTITPSQGASPASTPDPSDSLLLWYTFDDAGSGTATNYGSLGSAGDGTLMDDAAQVAGGVHNGALQLDGSDDIVELKPVPAAMNFDPQNEAFTLMVWAKSSQNNNWQAIVGIGSNVDNRQYILFKSDANYAVGYVGGERPDFADFEEGDVSDLNKWHHYALVNAFSDGAWKSTLYVNCVAIITWDSGTVTTNLPFAVGARSEPSGTSYRTHFQGLIDEVRVYDTVIGETAVCDIVTEGRIAQSATATVSSTVTPSVTSTSTTSISSTESATVSVTPTISSTISPVGSSPLVVWFGFEEPPGTTTISNKGSGGGQVSGTLSGDVDYDPNGGVEGGGLCFEGTDGYGDLGTPDLLNLDPSSDEYTISVWIRPKVSGVEQVILGRGENQESAQYMILRWDSDDAVAYIGGDVLDEPVGVDASGANLAENAWHLLCLTNTLVDGVMTANLYVNGTIVGQRTSGGTSDPGDVLLGARNQPGDNVDFFFTGCMDDLRVYTQPLTDDDILELFERVFPPSNTPSPTSTSTASSSVSITPTASVTAETASNTATVSVSPSTTGTVSSTSSNTVTPSTTGTASNTDTVTSTVSITGTVSNTATVTTTASATGTASNSATTTVTVSLTPSISGTESSTHSAGATPASSSSPTLTPTADGTNSPSTTGTASISSSSSVSSTVSASQTASITVTAESTKTTSSSVSSTVSVSPSVSTTVSITPSADLTPPPSENHLHECLQVYLTFDSVVGDNVIPNLGLDRDYAGGTLEDGASIASGEGVLGSGALELDGTGAHVNLGQPEVLAVDPLSQAFTISIWAKVLPERRQNYRSIIVRGTTPSTRVFSLYRWRDGGAASFSGGSVIRGPELADNGENWHQYTLTNYFDDETGKWKNTLFVDGVEAGSEFTGAGETDVDTIIGGRRAFDNNTGIDFPFIGYIDEFRFYCRKFSASEAWQMFVEGETGTIPTASSTVSPTTSGTVSVTPSGSPSLSATTSTSISASVSPSPIGTPPTPSPTPDLSDNLLIWYKFDSTHSRTVVNHGALGAEGNALLRDGAQQGLVAGVYGTGLRLDGIDDYAILEPVPSTLDFRPDEESFTLMAWTNSYRSGSWQAVMGRGSRVDKRTYMLMKSSEDYAVGYIGGTRPEFTDLVEGDVSDVGQWYHMTLVNEVNNGTSEGILYVNCVEIMRWPSGNALDDAPFVIGARPFPDDTGFRTFYNGVIDDVRIYDTAVTQGDICSVVGRGVSNLSPTPTASATPSVSPTMSISFSPSDTPSYTASYSVTPSNTQSPVADSGLAVWIRFDNDPDDKTISNSGTEGNGVNGTIHGGAAYDPDGGLVGGALCMDGTDGYGSLDHADVLDLDPETAFTISLWIRPLRSGQEQNVFGKGSNQETQQFMVLQAGNGDVGVVVGGTNDDDPLGVGVEGSTLSVGNWHMLSVVNSFDSGLGYMTSSLYVNETLVDTRRSGKKTSSDVVLLGARDAGDPLGMQGFLAACIDDLRVYFHELDDEDISDLFRNIIPPSPSVSVTSTMTATNTPVTQTASGTISSTSSVTSSITTTESVTMSASETKSISSTLSPTGAPSITESSTLTSSHTGTHTATISHTNTDTATFSASRTVTTTLSGTGTLSMTASPSVSPTTSITATISGTRSVSATVSPTRSRSFSRSSTGTPTLTKTESSTATVSATPTTTIMTASSSYSPSAASTVTSTPVPSGEPYLHSAVIRAPGNIMDITFSSPTDRALMYGELCCSCWRMFPRQYADILGTNPDCFWLDDSTIRVVIDTVTAPSLDVETATIGIRSGILSKQSDRSVKFAGVDDGREASLTLHSDVEDLVPFINVPVNLNPCEGVHISGGATGGTRILAEWLVRDAGGVEISYDGGTQRNLELSAADLGRLELPLYVRLDAYDFLGRSVTTFAVVEECLSCLFSVNIDGSDMLSHVEVEEDLHILSFVTTSVECADFAPLIANATWSFDWSARVTGSDLPTLPSEPQLGDTSAIRIPAGTLLPATTYEISVSAWPMGHTSFVQNATVEVTTQPVTLDVRIGGGNSFVRVGTTRSIEATIIVQGYTIGDTSNVEYTWSCEGCGAFAASSTRTQNVETDDWIVGNVYRLRCDVTITEGATTIVTNHHSVAFRVSDTHSEKAVSIRKLPLDMSDLTEGSAHTRLHAVVDVEDVRPFDCTARAKYVWGVTPGDLRVDRTKFVEAYNAEEPYIVLKPHSFTPGIGYQIAVNVSLCGETVAYGWRDLEFTQPATTQTLGIEERVPSRKPFWLVYDIEATSWTTENPPLRYSFGYRPNSLYYGYGEYYRRFALTTTSAGRLFIPRIPSLSVTVRIDASDSSNTTVYSERTLRVPTTLTKRYLNVTTEVEELESEVEDRLESALSKGDMNAFVQIIGVSAELLNEDATGPRLSPMVSRRLSYNLVQSVPLRDPCATGNQMGTCPLLNTSRACTMDSLCGNGYCGIGGSCVCDDGYWGESCSLAQCSESSNAFYNPESGKCQCLQGTLGPYCGTSPADACRAAGCQGGCSDLGECICNTHARGRRCSVSPEAHEARSRLRKYLLSQLEERTTTGSLPPTVSVATAVSYVTESILWSTDELDYASNSADMQTLDVIWTWLKNIASLHDSVHGIEGLVQLQQIVDLRTGGNSNSESGSSSASISQDQLAISESGTEILDDGIRDVIEIAMQRRVPGETFAANMTTYSLVTVKGAAGCSQSTVFSPLGDSSMDFTVCDVSATDVAGAGFDSDVGLYDGTMVSSVFGLYTVPETANITTEVTVHPFAHATNCSAIFGERHCATPELDEPCGVSCPPNSYCTDNDKCACAEGLTRAVVPRHYLIQVFKRFLGHSDLSQCVPGCEGACGDHGTCTSGGVCSCDQMYAGPRCQVRLSLLERREAEWTASDVDDITIGAGHSVTVEKRYPSDTKIVMAATLDNPVLLTSKAPVSYWYFYVLLAMLVSYPIVSSLHLILWRNKTTAEKLDWVPRFASLGLLQPYAMTVFIWMWTSGLIGITLSVFVATLTAYYSSSLTSDDYITIAFIAAAAGQAWKWYYVVVATRILSQKRSTRIVDSETRPHSANLPDNVFSGDVAQHYTVKAKQKAWTEVDDKGTHFDGSSSLFPWRFYLALGGITAAIGGLLYVLVALTDLEWWHIFFITLYATVFGIGILQIGARTRFTKVGYSVFVLSVLLIFAITIYGTSYWAGRIPESAFSGAKWAYVVLIVLAVEVSIEIVRFLSYKAFAKRTQHAQVEASHEDIDIEVPEKSATKC